MKAKHSGFTLIELVVVITILGILAATALPRFVALQVQARQAKLDGAVGAARGAAALAHADYLTRNLAANASASMEGTAVTQCNGYPTANAAGIIIAAQITNSATEFTVGAGGATGTSVVTVDVPGAAAGTCQFSYTAAAGTTVPANCNEPGNAPVVTVVARTCT